MIVFILARNQTLTEGQTFRFEGDDDVWVFLNQHQVFFSCTRGCVNVDVGAGHSFWQSHKSAVALK